MSKYHYTDFEEYIRQGEQDTKENLGSKCKICTLNCTLEETAVLEAIRNVEAKRTKKRMVGDSEECK